MRIFCGNVRQRPVEVADCSVSIYSADGEHAYLIVEADGPLVRVYMASDEGFAARAKSYGFSAPQELKLPQGM